MAHYSFKRSILCFVIFNLIFSLISGSVWGSIQDQQQDLEKKRRQQERWAKLLNDAQNFGKDPAPQALEAYVAELKAHFAADGLKGEQLPSIMMLCFPLEASEDRVPLAAIYGGLAPLYRGNSKGPDDGLAHLANWLEGAAMRVNLVGKKMVQIKGTLIDGGALDLDSYKGKVVLFNFWDTTCRPCIAEFPIFKKYREYYHKKGFEIIGLSQEQDRAYLEQFLKEREVLWPNVYDTSGKEYHHKPLIEQFGISGIPVSILVDRDGTVILCSIGGGDHKIEEMTTKLEELLGKFPKSDNAEVEK